MSLTMKKMCPVCSQDLYDGNPFKSFTKCRHHIHERCLSSNPSTPSDAARSCPICSKPTERPIIPAQSDTLSDFRNFDQSARSDQTHRELDCFSSSSQQTPRIRSIVRPTTPDSLSSSSSNLKENLSSKMSTTVWSCSICTYENDTNTDSCEICKKGRRPIDSFKRVSSTDFGPSMQLERSMSTATEDQTNLFASTSVKLEKREVIQEGAVEWSCLHCTYHNPANVPFCQMCENPKGSSQQTAVFDPDDDSYSAMGTEPSTPYLNGNDIQHDKDRKVLELKSSAFEDQQGSHLQRSMTDESDRTYSNDYNYQQRVEYTNEKTFDEQNGTFSKQDSGATNVDPISKEVKSSSLSIDTKTTSSARYRVLIPNVPMIGTDQELEKILRERLDRVRPSNSYQIRCYSSIGVAMIDVPNEAEQTYLINDLQSIVLNSEKNLIVHFVDDFQSNSYLVLRGNPNKSVSAKDLLQRWQTVLTFSVPLPCEIVSIEYQNIFKVAFPNFGEFLRVIHSDDFTFEGCAVRIYHRSNASFFEDLPTNVTEADISSAIQSLVGRQIDRSLLYVQCNPKNSTAIVIVSDAIVEWNRTNGINLNNQLYHKKQKLSLRLVIPSIPRDLSDDLVKKNALFENQLIDSKRVGDRLILDLEDPSIYAKCLAVGALRIQDQLLEIQAFSQIQAESKNRELIVKKWYETEMMHHDVDLKAFFDDLKKPFFNGRWNPKQWLDQFLPVCGIQDKNADRRRRLLRLTVMTDTLKIVEQKRYRIERDGKEQEIQLNPTKMRSVVYNSRSILHPQREMSDTFERTFPNTKVSVINKDCLIVYNELVQEKKSPLLLNMANAETPGGGYRQGAGAQEENIFRRSNYHLSLDMEMDEKEEADRFLKTDNAALKSLNRSDKIYPIAEFGAIYTSGITVFRDTEENGYAYLDKPWTNVCAIAVAAYNRPELHVDQQTIVDKMAIGTRKKIENLFSVALLHKHDSLVLSALGCGAFRNPPEHIVSIFQSVIEQYAGYFEEIRFAIVDDHNTGGRWNPTGNFAPFQKLDGFVAHPIRQEFEVKMIIGPFLIREKNGNRFKIDQVKIADLFLCQYGGLCHNHGDAQHDQKYAHPPLCYNYKKCQQVKNDKVHAISFTHLMQCQNAGLCELIKDPQHCMRFDHPEFCPDKSRCENTNKEHLKKFCHVPICGKGIGCYDYLQKNEKHCQDFRHIQKECSYGSKCAHFHNREHLANYRHPFRPPCPLTPYVCEFYQMFLEKRTDPSKKLDPAVEEHCIKFAHVCLFGQDCRENDPSHILNTIHVHRIRCPDQSKCSKVTDEEHLNSYTHPNIHDIRYLCNESGAKCRDRWKPEHIQRYRHAGNSNHLGVAQYSGLNSQINFVRNHHKLIDGVLKYVEDQSWKKSKPHIDNIIKWIRSLQPIHRCNQLIFESILVHGHVMSLSYMDRLRNSRFVANAVIQHPQVRQIIDHRENAALVQLTRDYVRALVAVEFDKQNSKPLTPMAVGVPIGPMMIPPIATVTTSSSSSSSSSSALPDEIEERKSQMRLIESQIRPHLREDNLKTIQSHTKMVVKASIKLNHSKTGIGYVVDQSLGTNEQVFSILGPHLGHYYGDIFIVFKRDIMYHPDANFSIQAATTFGTSENAYKWRPWLTDPGNPKDRIQHFHWTKLHCSVPDYEYAAALELMALTGLKKQTLDVTLDHVKNRWMHVDSHQVFEGHLPQLIPLDYIDRIYIPKSIFQSLSAEQQTAAKQNFGDNLKITKHVVTTDAHTLDDTRKEYQTYVLDQINRQIEKNHPQEKHGFTVTLPASKLKQYILMPMTIVQSSHRHNAPQDAIDTIYIYWQALGGDIILALSREKIENDKDQSHNRSLLCHISDPSKSHSDHEYHEPYSYITVDYPFSHDILMGDIKNLKTKSSSFHRGCNTYDFITYCLILKRKIGQVVLIHVGSNGIYNHQKLERSFQRNEIDLSTLNHIQISANNHPVPIQNFIITHEPIEEFHISFDKNSHSSLSSASKSDDDKPVKSTTEEKKSGVKGFYDRAKDFFFGSDDETKRKPCRDSVNCLLQYAGDRAKEHNKKYSHPCRFSEICRSPNDHPHLEHIPHRVPLCKYNENCRERVDPIHRAKYRHTNLPDFLVPCRDQRNCRNRTGEHRMKYSHGENVLELISKEKQSTDDSKRLGNNRRHLDTTDYGESNEFL